MSSSEYYVFQEDWPQPPDEKCTLEPIKSPTQSKKKKTSGTAKAKKNLSESLAGVTAAAVAVVMLSTSIPVFEDIVIDIPDYSRSDACLVCQQEDCLYFGAGYAGLRLCLDLDTYTDSYSYIYTDLSFNEYDDLQTMQGFLPHRSYIQAPISCVETEAGERCVLRLDSSLTSDLYDNWDERERRGFSSSDSSGRSYSGLFIPLVKRESSSVSYTGYDDASAAATDYLYVVISYDKTGKNRLVEPGSAYLDQFSPLDFDALPCNHVTRDIPGAPNAQVQLVSSLDQTLLNGLFEHCSAVVVETKNQVFDLGKTMRFEENDSVYRTYDDHDTISMISYYDFFEGAPGDFRHALTYDFPFKSYSIGASRDIFFSDDGWNNLLDLVFDLNQKAPETGHPVLFPAVELNPCTVNDITYRCCLLYHEETYYNTYDALCIMVPQQESEAAIQFEASLSSEELENLLQTLDPETAFGVSELLSQITLR